MACGDICITKNGLFELADELSTYLSEIECTQINIKELQDELIQIKYELIKLNKRQYPYAASLLEAETERKQRHIDEYDKHIETMKKSNNIILLIEEIYRITR